MGAPRILIAEPDDFSPVALARLRAEADVVAVRGAFAAYVAHVADADDRAASAAALARRYLVPPKALADDVTVRDEG